jgi:hypothetical protein
MTFRQVVATMLRRWYVPLVVVLVAAGFTSILVPDSGLYSTRTVVYFAYIQPNMVSIGPSNGTEDEGLIAFAGAVAAEINNGRPVARYAWDEAPLYGAGMRQGILVALADVGGQWMTSYNRAEIVIQIVGQSYDWVQATQQSLLERVSDRAQALQGPNFNDPKRRVSAEVSPLTDTIDHIVASRVEKIAAIASIILAALIVGTWGALVADRRAVARAQRRVRSGRANVVNRRQVIQ